MSEEIHKKIVAFLVGEFARTEHRSCTLVELLHSPQPGRKGTYLQGWDRKENPAQFEGIGQIEEMTSTILRRAGEYARDLPGSQRFTVWTQQYLGGRQHISFKIEAEEDEVLTEEAPTATGLVAQLMRHNEIKERTMMQMLQASLGTMSRTIEDLARENREMRNDRTRHLAELEENRSLQAERDLDLIERNALVQRKDAAFGKVMELLPVVASRFATGGDAGAQGPPAALQVLIKNLVDSLTDDQKARLGTMLTPNQAILFGEALRVANATPGPTNGESGKPS